MKRILITGAGSYIGTSLADWLARWPETYATGSVDTVSDSWKATDFSDFSAVVHVAGIAHIKETSKDKHLYFEVNRDLAELVAIKAKESGVGLFVFLSSMSVYGVEDGMITERTEFSPVSAYGKSKLEAEERILKLEDSQFRVAVLRPPMIYGPGCKGNYPRLSGLVRKLPFFPLIRNERSMLFIDHLCEFVRHLIDAGKGGLYFPQNEKYVNTSDLAIRIAQAHGKTLRLTKIFNPVIHIARIQPVRKLFGSLRYDMKLSNSPGGDYQTCDFGESIRITEQNDRKNGMEEEK